MMIVMMVKRSGDESGAVDVGAVMFSNLLCCVIDFPSALFSLFRSVLCKGM